MKQNVQRFVHASPTYDGGWKVDFFPTDMTEYGYTCIGEQTIEVDLPSDSELTKGYVSALRSKLDAMRARHYAEQQGLQEQINNMLALEHKS